MCFAGGCSQKKLSSHPSDIRIWGWASPAVAASVASATPASSTYYTPSCQNAFNHLLCSYTVLTTTAANFSQGFTILPRENNSALNPPFYSFLKSRGPHFVKKKFCQWTQNSKSLGQSKYVALYSAESKLSIVKACLFRRDRGVRVRTSTSSI